MTDEDLHVAVIGAVLARLRIRAHLSAAGLCQKAKLDARVVERVEAGAIAPGRAEAEAWLAASQTSLVLFAEYCESALQRTEILARAALPIAVESSWLDRASRLLGPAGVAALARAAAEAELARRIGPAPID